MKYLSLSAKIIFIASFLINSNLSAQILMDSTRVVFTKQSDVKIDLCADSILSRFTPTAQEIEFVDSIILQHVYSKFPHVLPFFLKSIYYRQYVGVFTTNGKIIYINAQCNNKPDMFLTYASLQYRGGGKCYYQSLIKLNSRQFQEFRFNTPR